MKYRILHFLFFMASATALAQEGIIFRDASLADLLSAAKKENKLIFLDAYASWCGPCKLLAKNVFPQPAVRDFYNTNFINAHFDMEKGEGPAIAQKYAIRSYPTLLFLNGDGEIIQKGMGYMAAEDFLNFGKQANNPLNKLGSPKALFEKGEADPAFLVNIINTNANSDFDFAKKAAERYFSVKKDNVYSKDEINYILYFTKSAADPLYKVFSAQKEQISGAVGAEVYKNFDNQMKLSEVLQHTLDTHTGALDEAYFYKNAVRIVGREEAEKTLNRLKVNYYPEVGNFAAYEKAALDYYKEPDNFQAGELDKAAWIFAQFVTNPASLQTAKVWAEKSVMKGETMENTYILAKIYQKLGDKASAFTYARMSKDMAIASGKDTDLADQLLSELK